MIWRRFSSILKVAKSSIFRASQDLLHPIRVTMDKQLQNAQTICGSRIGWDTENDDIMIYVTKRTFSPVPDNDQETVCWFEPFVDEVSAFPIHIIAHLSSFAGSLHLNSSFVG